MTHDNADATAANGTAGELVARVEAGFEVAKRDSWNDNLAPNERTGYISQVSPEIEDGVEAFRALVAAHDDELARLNRDFAALRIDYALQAETLTRLRTFVEKIVDNDWDNNEWYKPEREARKLLASLRPASADATTAGENGVA